MKIYNPKHKNPKSWSIALVANPRIEVVAVDSSTGEEIAILIRFQEGKILLCDEAKGGLESEGYDPNEHGNSWDAAGRIIVTDQYVH